MNKEIYQLNYRSKSKIQFTSQDLDDILDTATTVNGTLNISGCLIYHGDYFIQILEGAREDVIKLYETIAQDERHSEVTLLWDGDVKQRYFTGWNMAFYRPEEKNLIQYVNNLLMLSELSDKTSGSLLSFWSTVRNVIRGDEQN